jgi:hypothetical protein
MRYGSWVVCTFVEIPVTVAAIAAVFAPILAAKFTVVVEKPGDGAPANDGSASGGAASES